MNDAAGIFIPPKGGRYAGWLILAAYLLLLLTAIRHHELWGDELHSWNIAKAAGSYTELLHLIRYEGHPPLWYTLMWLLSRNTHDLVYLQALQYGLACGCTAMLVLRSPFPVLLKAMLPFGYYFLYEYGTLSRNYAVGLLSAFVLCDMLYRGTAYRKAWLYYLMLFLLSCSHLLGAVLAASVHIYYISSLSGQSARSRVWQLLAGLVLLLPSLYCIFPPSDSEMNLQFWAEKWNRQQLADIAEAPLRSFVPVPAWWQYHFWNTQALVVARKELPWLRLPVYLLSAGCLSLAIALLRGDRRALYLFLGNFILTCLVAAIFPLNSARYVGFIFIAFVAACWLQPVAARPRWGNLLLVILACLQLAAAGVALSFDLPYRFSNAYRAPELAGKVPAGQPLVTDYWCLNNLAAFMDKPFYCIELNRELSFILWDRKMAKAMRGAAPYGDGLDRFFSDRGIPVVYMMSVNSPAKIKVMEPALADRFRLQAIDSCTGAIERYSDLYLYRVSRLHDDALWKR